METVVILKRPITIPFIQIFLASLFMSCLAQIRIPLFFSPVPITGQTLAVMLIAGSIGCRKASWAVLCYLIEGCFLPIWAGGGSGIAALAGPTGGYLFGFVLQAFLIGFLLERKTHPFLAFFLPSLALLAVGSAWLSVFIGYKAAIVCGFLPFLPGDLIKIAVAMTTLKKLYVRHFI
jgi:biotin transport system substrate-specific component